MSSLDQYPRSTLIKLVEMYAKNWLAHDGCWFLAAEETYGTETAMELDGLAWKRFAVSEAKRIMKTFSIPRNGGLTALAEAFQYRLYAVLNAQRIEWKNGHTLIFKMQDCRVQKTRKAKNLADFPCKSVGIIEFTEFARTVDHRIRTECIACPPDKAEGFYCAWAFSLDLP